MEEWNTFFNLLQGTLNLKKISSLSLYIYSLLFVHAKYFYSRQTTMMSSMRWIWQKHFTMVQFPTCKSRKGDARENYYDAVRESLAPSFSLSRFLLIKYVNSQLSKFPQGIIIAAIAKRKIPFYGLFMSLFYFILFSNTTPMNLNSFIVFFLLCEWKNIPTTHCAIPSILFSFFILRLWKSI